MIETNTMVGTGMKVVSQRDELAQKLGVVARAVSTRASVQILSGVLLRADAGRLHLAATDMELSLRSTLEAQIAGDGAVVVPGRLLVDLVRLLPDNDVTIEHRVDESVVRITSGASSSKRSPRHAHWPSWGALHKQATRSTGACAKTRWYSPRTTSG